MKQQGLKIDIEILNNKMKLLLQKKEILENILEKLANR